MRCHTWIHRWAPLLFVLPLCALSCDINLDGAKKRASLDQGPLPQLSSIPKFSFTNQDGRTFGSTELQGTPYLAAFVFTRCPSICPEVMHRMKEVDIAVKAAKKQLNMLSISVDPENDTPAVLKEYAQKYGANEKNWNLLTGDHKEIAKTAEEGFKLGLSGTIDESKPHLGITHGSHFVLVDGTGTIRGYYRSSEATTPQQIASDLDRL